MPGAVPGEPLRCLVDGVPEQRLPVTDRGLSFGDGLFETLLVRDGRPCQWRRHWDRLDQGCRRLGLPPPREAVLTDEARELLRGVDSGVLKVLVTRGVGGRGYAAPTDARPRRILLLFPAPDYPPEWQGRGVAVRICSTPATHNPALAGLKHLNRLDSVLARAEWSETEIAEGLMAGPEGDIVGGTMSNLFLWDGSRLLTPKVDRCGIAGTVRALTMELAANRGIPCLEARLSLTDLLTGRGLFLTSSLLGVWPVRRLDRRAYDPGELPLQLIGAVRRQAQTPEVPGP